MAFLGFLSLDSLTWVCTQEYARTVSFGKHVKQQELELGFLNAATASGEQELDSCTGTFPLVF